MSSSIAAALATARLVPRIGVGAEPGLVVGAVEVEHHLVDEPLVERVEALERVGDLVVDVPDGLEHPLAAVAVAAVAQLDRFVFAGRGSRRHRGAAERAGVEQHLDLDGGVATRIEDFASGDADDLAHVVQRTWQSWCAELRTVVCNSRRFPQVPGTACRWRRHGTRGSTVAGDAAAATDRRRARCARCPAA